MLRQVKFCKLLIDQLQFAQDYYLFWVKGDINLLSGNDPQIIRQKLPLFKGTELS